MPSLEPSMMAVIADRIDYDKTLMRVRVTKKLGKQLSRRLGEYFREPDHYDIWLRRVEREWLVLMKDSGKLLKLLAGD